MPSLLGIDLGTSSAKAILFDEEGHPCRAASVPYALHTPRPGWAEQCPTDWWDATCRAIRQSIADSDPQEIRGVGVSGQMNGALLVDRAGEPLRDAIIWLDGRSGAQCAYLTERAGDVVRERALNPPQPVHSAAKLLWLRDHEPTRWRDATAFLQPKDYLNLRLTGVVGTDRSDASASLLLDLHTRDWATGLWARFGIDRVLPRLYDSSDVIGEVTAEAALQTGLRAGTPVVAGGADMACMAVGSGVIEPGIVAVTIGTAGHVTTAAEFVSDAGYNRIYPMCHAIPGRYFWLGCVFSGGLSLQWFHDHLGEEEAARAEQQGQDAYDLLTELAATVEPGASGLYFLPWLTGAATPHADGNARGAFIGLTLRHGKAEMVRAILEGVAYNLRDSLDVFEELGIPIREVRIGEGGTRSALWRAIQANVFGRPLRALRTRDASVVGAAAIAGVGTGVFRDFRDACDRLVSCGASTEPDPRVVERYAQYHAVYRRFYDALRPAFDEIARHHASSESSFF